jgi:predicted amidophosphoribosyltransferase
VPDKHRRTARESKTIEAMLHIYCHGQHGTQDGLCAECQELLGYARARLDKCPFVEKKPTCAKCPVHCYKPAIRKKTAVVMRYAGPRMFHRHPILTFYHLLDGLRRRGDTPSGRE